LLHAVAFVFVVPGDVAAGEPEVMISVRSAMDSTGIWDRSRRALSSSMFIGKTNDAGLPTSLQMSLPDMNILIFKNDAGRWEINRQPHKLNRVPAVALRYRPRLERPLGSSRLSRPVLSVTDSALRTV